jgi:hypothetical protein
VGTPFVVSELYSRAVRSPHLTEASGTETRRHNYNHYIYVANRQYGVNVRGVRPRAPRILMADEDVRHPRMIYDK